jgi:hypothetical protein
MRSNSPLMGGDSALLHFAEWQLWAESGGENTKGGTRTFVPGSAVCLGTGCNRQARNPSRVQLAKATSDSITGTSTSAWTPVASAAPEFSPKRPMVTGTASSKTFDVPIYAQSASTFVVATILAGTSLGISLSHRERR